MKALYVTSGYVYEKNNRYYSLTLTPRTIRNLYFPYCDHLDICMRKRKTENVEGLTEMDMPEITVRCPDINPSATSLYFTKTRKYYKFLESIIEDYDFIIARQGILGCFAAKIARKKSIPCVFEAVGCTFDSFWGHSLVGKFQAIPLDRLVKNTIKNSDDVIYVTDRYLQELYPSNGDTVGISDVELAKIDDNTLANRLERIKSLDDKTPMKMVTVAGVNARVKGHIYAMRALAKLKERNIIIEYHIVGEGKQDYLRGQAKALGIENQVYFAGALKHDDIFEYLDKMDFYIQPSLQEGLPRAVVEAMSRGLLCMCSRIAGMPELVEDEMLFTKKCVNEIVEIILSIDKDKLIHHAKVNFERAKDFEQERLKRKRNLFYNNFFAKHFQKEVK